MSSSIDDGRTNNDQVTGSVASKSTDTLRASEIPAVALRFRITRQADAQNVTVGEGDAARTERLQYVEFAPEAVTDSAAPQQGKLVLITTAACHATDELVTDAMRTNKLGGAVEEMREAVARVDKYIAACRAVVTQVLQDQFSSDSSVQDGIDTNNLHRQRDLLNTLWQARLQQLRDAGVVSLLEVDVVPKQSRAEGEQDATVYFLPMHISASDPDLEIASRRFAQQMVTSE